MDLMSSIFKKQRQHRESEEKALKILQNKKARVNTVNVTVPKTIKDKVKLAESM